MHRFRTPTLHRQFVAVAVVLTSTACSQTSSPAETNTMDETVENTGPNQVLSGEPELLPGERMGRRLPIGSPCNADDGWQPVSRERNDAEMGVPLTIPSPEERDFGNLPPGIGYCLSPGGLYPHGYFTMNCARDSECPPDAACDTTLCRAPCRSNADCAPPTECKELVGLRVCYFPGAILQDIGNRSSF